MSGWVAKRFWSAAAVEAQEGGFAVRLDGRPVKTPAKAPLLLPTRAMAEAVAAEWDAVGERIDPMEMPVTRSANAAIDKVRPQRSEVVSLLAEYGGTDLLCYRAPGPAALAARQEAEWGPLLEWAAETFGARLAVTQGVIPVAQPPEALAALRAPLETMDPFRLAAFHDLVGLSGSLVLALAVTQGRLPAEAAWALSRIDETFQTEEWGEDEEAAEAAAIRRAAFVHAARFWALCEAPES